MTNIRQILKEELIIIDRKNLLNEHSLSLIENPEYVKHVLGINVPINENNSFKIRKQIIEAQLNLQGILNSANQLLGQAVTKGKEKAVVIVDNINTAKDVIILFKDLILSPEYMNIATKTLSNTCTELSNYLDSMATRITGLINNKPITDTFNKLIQHAKNVLESLSKETGWTGFLSMLGFSTLITYLKDNVFDKLMSLGEKFFTNNPDLVSGLTSMFNSFKSFKETIINSSSLTSIFSWFQNITSSAAFQHIQLASNILVSAKTIIQPIVDNIDWHKATTITPELKTQ